MQWLQRVAAIVIAALSLFVAYTLGRIEASRDAASTIVFQFPTSAVDRLLAAEAPNPASVQPVAQAPRSEVPDPVNGEKGDAEEKREVALDPPEMRSPRIEPRHDEPAPKLRVISEDDRNRLARAGRAMLADLAVIDKIPSNRQRPLLEAQLRHFGLKDFATEVNRGEAESSDRPHRDLAAFVTDLESTMRDPTSSLLSLRDDTRTDALFEALKDYPPPKLPPIASRADRKIVIDDVGRELTESERRALDELLGMKESWIEGSYAPAVRLATNDKPVVPRRTEDPFAAAMQATIISALAEAGITEWDPTKAFSDIEMHSGSFSFDLDALERASMDIGKNQKGYVIRVQFGAFKAK